MAEREDILTTLQTRFEAHSDSPTVTRDWSKDAVLVNLPKILLIPRQDEVKKSYRAQGSEINDRHWTISIIGIIDGTTSEDAPTEIETFMSEVKKLAYATQSGRIGTAQQFREIYTGPPLFQGAGEAVILQEWMILVIYREEISKLFV